MEVGKGRGGVRRMVVREAGDDVMCKREGEGEKRDVWSDV
jgi:hypothetical protein